jgi:hypothetical protein
MEIDQVVDTFNEYELYKQYMFQDSIIIDSYMDLEEVIVGRFVGEKTSSVIRLPATITGANINIHYPLKIVVSESIENSVKASLMYNQDTGLYYNYKEAVPHSFEHSSELRKQKVLTHTLYIADVIFEDSTQHRVPGERCFSCQLAETHWLNNAANNPNTSKGGHYFIETEDTDNEAREIKSTVIRWINPDTIAYPLYNNGEKSERHIVISNNSLGVYTLLEILEKEHLTLDKAMTQDVYYKKITLAPVNKLSVEKNSTNHVGLFEHIESGQLQLINLNWMRIYSWQ